MRRTTTKCIFRCSYSGVALRFLLTLFLSIPFSGTADDPVRDPPPPQPEGRCFFTDNHFILTAADERFDILFDPQRRPYVRLVHEGGCDTPVGEHLDEPVEDPVFDRDGNFLFTELHFVDSEERHFHRMYIDGQGPDYADIAFTKGEDFPGYRVFFPEEPLRVTPEVLDAKHAQLHGIYEEQIIGKKQSKDIILFEHRYIHGNWGLGDEDFPTRVKPLEEIQPGEESLKTIQRIADRLKRTNPLLAQRFRKSLHAIFIGAALRNEGGLDYLAEEFGSRVVSMRQAQRMVQEFRDVLAMRSIRGFTVNRRPPSRTEFFNAVRLKYAELDQMAAEGRADSFQSELRVGDRRIAGFNTVVGRLVPFLRDYVSEIMGDFAFSANAAAYPEIVETYSLIAGENRTSAIFERLVLLVLTLAEELKRQYRNFTSGSSLSPQGVATLHTMNVISRLFLKRDVDAITPEEIEILLGSPVDASTAARRALRMTVVMWRHRITQWEKVRSLYRQVSGDPTKIRNLLRRFIWIKRMVRENLQYRVERYLQRLLTRGLTTYQILQAVQDLMRLRDAAQELGVVSDVLTKLAYRKIRLKAPVGGFLEEPESDSPPKPDPEPPPAAMILIVDESLGLAVHVHKGDVIGWTTGPPGESAHLIIEQRSPLWGTHEHDRIIFPIPPEDAPEWSTILLRPDTEVVVTTVEGQVHIHDSQTIHLHEVLSVEPPPPGEEPPPPGEEPPPPRL